MMSKIVLNLLRRGMVNPRLRAALAGFVDKLGVGFQGKKIGLLRQALDDLPRKGAGTWAKLNHHFPLFQLGLICHKLSQSR